MPELPDLTVFAENLDKMVVGKKIVQVIIGRGLRLNVPASVLAEALRGLSIEAVERWGKELRFLFAGGRILHVHLMLTGGFALTRNPDAVAHLQLGLEFEDGSWLVMADEKAMATVALDPVKDDAAPDALAVTGDELKRLIGKFPKAKAKAFLLDQKVMRGIGNAYADEILWEAKIAPQSVMAKLPDEAAEMLADKIMVVLKRAIVSIKERNPGIIAGEIRDFLLVHNPSHRLSPGGRPIIREKIGGKTTYFTDEQKLYL